MYNIVDIHGNRTRLGLNKAVKQEEGHQAMLG